MTLLVLLLLVLVLRLASGRSEGDASGQSSTRAAWIAAAAAVIGSLAPALRDAPALAGPNALLASDAATHLSIAQDVAETGVPHGWIPTYNGGFPIALHYPCTGWLLTAGLLRVGVHTVVAVRGLGFIALIAVPLLVFITARRAGARALAAASGAVCVAWVSPYIQFSGGWESFFVVGLLSQVLVVPIVVGWVSALVRPARFDLAPMVAALCAATHPQVFTATALVLTAAAAAGARSAMFWRVVRSAIAGGILALAIYGPGMASMNAPFGWPPNLNWRLIGFGPGRVLDWLLDGDLLDYKHGSFVTSAWLAGCVAHLFRARRPLSRAVLVASFTTLVLCSWGPAIASAGALGRIVLSVFQPMRALVLVPLVATATLVTALDVLASWLAASAERIGAARVRRLLPLILPGALVLVAMVELPPRVDDLHAIAVAQSARDSDRCIPPIDGFDASLVQRWVAEAPYGRTAFDRDSLTACASMHGAELRRQGPMAGTAGAGAHVGVHAVAFTRVAPERPGSAARAEFLGIRTLIGITSRRPGPPDRWQLVERSGELELSRRIGGTDMVGVGCVRGALRGSERALTNELFRVLSETGTSSVLDDPQTLVALEPSSSAEVEHVALEDDCDASRASVEERPREPGAYEAVVTTDKPVDVVFRATAYSGWKVREGDIELRTRRVVPGFFTVRVGPGTHHLEAIVGLPRWYLPVVALATLLAIALGALDHVGAARAIRTWMAARAVLLRRR